MLGTLREVMDGIAVRRANAPLAASLRTLAPDRGTGAEWQSTGYGEYYARSADVYAAVKLRAEAASRPPLQVREVDASGAWRWVGPEHPAQRLLDTVNGWWSRSDLLIATETYLCLWGAAFWYLGRSVKASASGAPDEIWALRPDRVRIVRDPERYVAGFVYEERGRETALLPEEVVWFRYFNPLEEFAGFAPMAAARLTADMGMDALRFNREFFRNGAQPQDLVFRANGPVTDGQITEFFSKLEARHTGPGRAHHGGRGSTGAGAALAPLALAHPGAGRAVQRRADAAWTVARPGGLVFVCESDAVLRPGAAARRAVGTAEDACRRAAVEHGVNRPVRREGLR